MSKNRRLCKLLACMMAVAAVLGTLLPVWAAEEGPAEAEFRYRYVLEVRRASNVGTDLSTECDLYVQALSEDATPLHGGTVALGIPGNVISVVPAEPFELRNYDGAANAYETGTALGKSYVGFSWNRTATEQPLTMDEAHRQKLATITVSGGNGELDAFTLVPWVDTRTGKIVLQQRQQAQASGSAVRIDEYEALMQNFWRYESLTTADVGFYQGFYEVDGPDGQRAVDIENGWQAFQIMAYDKAKPITLIFERWDEEAGKYQPYADAVYQLADPTTVGQNGKFTAGIDFSKLKRATGEAAGELIELEQGTYKLTVSKQSHVQRYATDLTVKGSEGNVSLFPELTGLVLYLPCGDVTGDNRIKLQDRNLLTAPGRYGTAAADSPYDLNGDGRVDLRDLIILEDPINYGKSSTKFYEKETLEGGGA